MNISRHLDSYGEESHSRSLGSTTVRSARADMVGNFSTPCASDFLRCAAAKRPGPAIDCPNGIADDVREPAGQPPPPPSLPGSGHKWVRIGAIATDRGRPRGGVKRSGAGFFVPRWSCLNLASSSLRIGRCAIGHVMWAVVPPGLQFHCDKYRHGDRQDPAPGHG